MSDGLDVGNVTVTVAEYQELLDDQRQLNHLRGLGAEIAV